MDCSMPGFPVLQQLLNHGQIHVHWVGDAIQPSILSRCPLLLLPSIFPSISLFQRVCSSHEVAKVLELQFQHQSFQWIFRTDFLQDWLDLLAVQRILRSLLQHHSSKATMLWCSAFFIVQFSHPYMTTGKTIALATHFSTLAWKIPWTEEPGRLQSMGSLRVGHNWVTSLSLSCIGEGNGNPLQCSCLENPRDGGACWAAIYGVAQSRTRLKRLSSSNSRLFWYMLKFENQCFIL